MSNAKFTPGPLFLSGQVKECRIGNFTAIAGEFGPPTAYVATEDDARLYAAAPDLLAACEAALRTLQDWDRDDGECGAELRHAIAKATTGAKE